MIYLNDVRSVCMSSSAWSVVAAPRCRRTKSFATCVCVCVCGKWLAQQKLDNIFIQVGHG